MNQNQILQAMGAENKRLREHIVQMQKDVGQGKFMEDLVCAALTGVVAHYGDRSEPTETATKAINYAEAVLQEIVLRISTAQGLEEETP